MILVVENTIPAARDVAVRVAERTLAQRGADYADEVRRLLDAALQVVRQHGTTSRPRVADIVAAAGLSNDTFYRHFPSKDALVAALLEDGTDRLVSYLTHQMSKEPTREGQVRRWVEGVLSQANEDLAATTLAVLWNGGSVGANCRHNASAPVAALLHEPFEALGNPAPALDAGLVAHAMLGKLSEHLWLSTAPGRAEIEHLVEFCLAVATRSSVHPANRRPR